MDSNAVTWGWQRAITYNREEDGDLDDILLLGSEADFQLYKNTDRASLPGDHGPRYNNWIYQHPNLTYILVNPPSPEFEEAAKQRLMSDFDTLDYKGRQTYTWTQTINDTITPEDSLDEVYSQGQYADLAVIWKTMGPSGGGDPELDSLGRALWGTVYLNNLIQYPDDYGYLILKGEMFTAGAPSTADADTIQYPQYQLTFFGDDLPPPNQIFYGWGNSPYGMVNYRGQDIAIEILKMTMKLDYFYKYGNGVKWDTPRVIIPETTIN